MDFLDQTFASPDRALYVEFLGLGNKKQKASAENAYEADIQNRYPFSDNCDEQKKIIVTMLDESKQTLVARNSAKKNSRARNDLTGKLRAFDQYIPAAQEYLKNTSCVAKPGAPANASDSTLNSMNPNSQVANQLPAGGMISGSKSKLPNYLMIGFGLLVLTGGTMFFIRKLKK